MGNSDSHPNPSPARFWSSVGHSTYSPVSTRTSVDANEEKETPIRARSRSDNNTVSSHMSNRTASRSFPSRCTPASSSRLSSRRQRKASHFLGKLPHELRFDIIKYLDFDTRIRLSCVCNLCHELIQSEGGLGDVWMINSRTDIREDKHVRSEPDEVIAFVDFCKYKAKRLPFIQHSRCLCIPTRTRNRVHEQTWVSATMHVNYLAFEDASDSTVQQTILQFHSQLRFLSLTGDIDPRVNLNDVGLHSLHLSRCKLGESPTPKPPRSSSSHDLGRPTKRNGSHTSKKNGHASSSRSDGEGTDDCDSDETNEDRRPWRGWSTVFPSSLMFLCLHLCDFDGTSLSEAFASCTPNLFHLALFKCEWTGKLELPGSLRSLHYRLNKGRLSVEKCVNLHRIVYHVDMFRESNEVEDDDGGSGGGGGRKKRKQLDKYGLASYLLKRFRVLTSPGYSLSTLHFVQIFNFSLASPNVLQFAPWGQCSNLTVIIPKPWSSAFEFQDKFRRARFVVYSYPETVLDSADRNLAMEQSGKRVEYQDVLDIEKELRLRTRKCMFFDNEHHADGSCGDLKFLVEADNRYVKRLDELFGGVRNQHPPRMGRDG